MWEVLGTDEFADWYRSLEPGQQEAVASRVDLLEERGPGLGRPTVGEIRASRHHNLKELRASAGGALRVLFLFDPLRRAILLVGGDKSEDGAWSAWYPGAIARAEELYDEYLREEGLL